MLYFGFPASQAALAKVNTDDPQTADRFEVYYQGAELANGFHELSDADEQRLRFIEDNKKDVNQAYPSAPLTKRFLPHLNQVCHLAPALP